MLRSIFRTRAPLRSLCQTLTLTPLFCSHSHSILLKPSNLVLSSSLSHSREKQEEEVNRDPPKLFVVQPRLRPHTLLKSKLDEALNLANSLEEQRDDSCDSEFSDKGLPPHLVVQNPAARSPRADTYFGQGTVQTIKCHLNATGSEDGLVAVFVNAILTGIQQRNLERAWGKPVLDRVGLIIEIFNAHAQTKEGKLQAELAALMYKRTRLVRVRGPDGRYTFGSVGEAEVVSARGRGSGGRGFISGAGETELQLQRRRIVERRNQLLAEIKEVRRTRALQRAGRKRHGGSHGQDMATVAVVGYTNAGKSTLVGALSESYLYSDDRLFATVDPKLRSVILPSGRKVLLSDTVGFISELPVQLVQAFHATLEEVVEADLLVHVLDSSAPNLDEHRATVMQVLQQIGVSEDKLQNMIEVWNKIDLQEKEIDAEDENVLMEQFSGEDVDEDDNNDDIIEAELSAGDAEETLCDEELGDCSNGWPSLEDVKDAWDDQQKDSSKEQMIMGKDSESVPHVKTSAIMEVGLQELLELIDDRLKTQRVVVETSVIDRKWRPPRAQDSEMAVEH